MYMDISATTFQLLGAILVSIDAFTKRTKYEDWEKKTAAYIESKFTSVSEFKRTRSRKLLSIFALIIVLFYLSTLALPLAVKFAASFSVDFATVSLVTFILVLSLWIFLYGMAAQAVMGSVKELKLLIIYYTGIFLLYSDRGPIYVLGFLSIVFGYSIQLISQLGVL